MWESRIDTSDLSSSDLSEGPVGVEQVGGQDARSALTDAARCLSLGASLSNRGEAFAGVEEDIRLLGLDSFPTTSSWEARLEALEESETALGRTGLGEMVQGGEVAGRGQRLEMGDLQGLQAELWGRLREEGTASSAYAWLRSMSASPEVVVSTSANVAMSHWTARKGQEVPAWLQSARRRARQAARSSDPLARAIAEVARRPSPGKGEDEPPAAPWTPPATEPFSTIIHGTNAWIGDWWRPGGEFFEYVASQIRPNLYVPGDCFSWSGRYSQRHRDVAARRFSEWYAAKGAMPLDVLFGHSYGGCVALDSTAYGVKAKTVVLLSSPDHVSEVEWRNIGRCVSLRIHLDLVLLAARRPQRFRTNVEEHYLPRWFVLHGDSHERDWWEQGDWPRALKLLA